MSVYLFKYKYENDRPYYRDSESFTVISFFKILTWFHDLHWLTLLSHAEHVECALSTVFRIDACIKKAIDQQLNALIWANVNDHISKGNDPNRTGTFTWIIETYRLCAFVKWLERQINSLINHFPIRLFYIVMISTDFFFLSIC